MNIVELAKEAGLQLNVYAESYPVIAHQLEKFYELAFAAGAAQERERCALVCITLGEYYAECDDFEAEDVAHACACSIRESMK